MRYIVGEVRNRNRHHEQKFVWCQTHGDDLKENRHLLEKAAARQLGGASFDWEAVGEISSYADWREAMETAHELSSCARTEVVTILPPAPFPGR